MFDLTSIPPPIASVLVRYHARSSTRQCWPSGSMRPRRTSTSSSVHGTPMAQALLVCSFQTPPYFQKLPGASRHLPTRICGARSEYYTRVEVGGEVPVAMLTWVCSSSGSIDFKELQKLLRKGISEKAQDDWKKVGPLRFKAPFDVPLSALWYPPGCPWVGHLSFRKSDRTRRCVRRRSTSRSHRRSLTTIPSRKISSRGRRYWPKPRA
jgi:hypothetical protein